MSRNLPSTSAPIPPVKLAHVVFRTRQLENMIAWYATVLGAKMAFRNENMAFMTYDDEHHRIALISGDLAERPAEPTIGFFHAAFTYNDLGDLLSTYRRLKNEGIEPVRGIKHGPTVSLYYRDPDLNDIELQIDVYEDIEVVNDFLAGEAFSKDPIGPLFDPEEMIQQYESGVSFDIMTHRP